MNLRIHPKIELRLFLLLMLIVLVLIALAPISSWTQTMEVGVQLGTAGLEESRGIAVDQAGNVYITGSTDGSLAGTNLGGRDAFLAKYNSGGALQWIQQLGSRGDDISYGVAIDNSGNPYITGSTSDQLGASHQGALDAWLAKYDSNGNLLWIEQLGTATDDTGYGVAVDASGNVYITGTTFDRLGAAHFGDGDAFLAKYDSNGRPLWLEQLGTRQLDSARGVAVNALGDLYITGSTADALGGSFNGGVDAFLARYDTSGALQWVKQLGNTGIDDAFAVAVDNSNNIYMAGRTDGFLGGTSQGGFDAWVAMYGVSGIRQWTRQLGTPFDDSALGAAVDGAGNVYLTGWTEGALGGTNSGGRDAWAALYERNSNRRWTYQLGTSQADDSSGIAVDSANNYYLTGTTSGALGRTFQGGTDAWMQAYSQAPSILSFSPGSGSTGTSVTILGKNFTGTTAVRFNGASASFTVNTQAQITATLPASASTGRITVTNPYGTATSATDFIVSTTPSVTLSATPTNRTAVAGQPAIYTININRANYPGQVDLSVSGLPTGATYSFSSDPTTASSSNLRIDTTTTTATGTRTLTISASATGVTIAPIPVTLTVTPPQSVILSATPTSGTVAAGRSATYTININRTSFWNPVSLSLSGLPSGTQYSFSPNPASGQVATLTIPTTYATPVGTYTLTISGTATGVTIAPISVTLTVTPSLILSATPTSRTITAGHSATYTINIDRTSFLNPVSLSLSGLPSDAQYSFSLNPASGQTSTLTITTAHAKPVGTYPLTISGTAIGVTIAPIDVTLTIDPDMEIREFGNWGDDHSSGLALDGSGNFYIVGSTRDAFPGETYFGESDAFLAKYDSSMSRVWVKQFGTSSFDGALGLALDSSGNIYVVGSTGGDIDGTGSGSHAGLADAWLAKFDSSGTRQWIKQFGTSEMDFSTSVAVGSSGNVYVSGSTGGDLDGTGSQTHAGGDDVWTAKFNGSGVLQWINQRGSSSDDSSEAIAVDSSGNVYITGTTEGDLDGAGSETHHGKSDGFIVKFDNSGSLQWIRQFGSTDYDFPKGLAVDNSGNIYVTGEAYGDMDGAGPGLHAGYSDAWLAKYDSAGTRQWIRQFGTSGSDNSAAVTTDSAGDVYITGETSGDLDGSGASYPPGSRDAWVAKYNSSGALQWIEQRGISSSDRSKDVAVDSAGNIYITGDALSVISTNPIEWEVFLAKYIP